MITESDVEQKVIYKLLTNPSPDGLGFYPDDIQTKHDIRKIAVGKGRSQKLYFPDYAVVIDGIPAIIVEAKAPSDDDLEEAFREARLYANEINALYDTKENPCERVIATNGKRLIAGHADKQKPLIDLALKSGKVTNQDYIDLLEFSGRETVAASVSEIRSKKRGQARYTKPVFALGGKSVINESVGFNDFGANVSLEYQSLFNPETIQEKAEIVENAYIRSKRRETHIAPIDRILRATVPPHQRNSNIIEDTEKPREILEKLGDFKQRDKLKNELCLLVGGVGAGKSTFTEFLRLKALPQSLVNSTRWINVDLNNAPLSKDKIYDWILISVTDKIKALYSDVDFDSLEFLKRLYQDELEAVSKGRAALYPPESEKHLDMLADELGRLQSDSRQTLINLIALLFEEKGLLLVIVLDNCDKRTRDDQLLMFEVAAWLKSEFRCLIFLPLRDTTYDIYANQPPLDTVIKDLVFRIEAPLLEKVLSARLSYLLRSIDEEAEEFSFGIENGAVVRCDRSEISNFMRCIVTTLFQDQHFKSIIKGLAGRNIRKGLEVVLDFCKSGHISADEILRMRFSNGDYRLPTHLVYRVLLKGNRRYFSDEKSRLVNVFHSDARDELPDPFVRLDLLGWLRENRSVSGPNNTKGYHKVSTLVHAMQGLGHARSRVISEIESLVESELIMTEGLTRNVSLDDLIHITASGYTHLNIIRNINYLSTVSEDTFFRDSSQATKIADNLVGRGLFKAGSLDAALGNSSTLIDYLARYSTDFFFENQIATKTDKWNHKLTISDLRTYLDSKKGMNITYSAKVSISEDYPRGSEHFGQVVSIQEYGIFVEFDSGFTCFVHKSDFNSPISKVFDEIEEGDEVIVKINEYSAENQRFKGALVDY